jgi:hypothetical protein
MRLPRLACRRSGLVLVTGLWAMSAAAASRVEFRPVAVGGRGDDARAVALDTRSDRLAVGDDAGVLLGPRAGPYSRVLRRGPVRDLAFLPDSVDPAGALLVATDRGLYRVVSETDARPVTPGMGELARQVLRIAVAPGAVAVATADGAYVSHDARLWKRLAGSVPSGPASAVALRSRGGRVVCWAAIDGRLWRVALQPDAAGFAAGDAARITLPFASSGGEPVDLVFGWAGFDLAVLYPRAIALRPAGGGDWQLLRPGLPPGAAAVRLAAGLERLWLGTDRGLLEAPAPVGPWRRAAPPAGNAAVTGLADAGARLYVATARGLLSGSPAPEASAARVPRTPEPGPDPDIARVHQAALAYLSLQPSRTAWLWRGVERRGWLPVVSFSVDMNQDESRGVDADQSFVSGDTRHLTDRDRSRRDEFDVGLRLSWDLGDTAYHPEAIDVSREAREIVELRNDVLDEITHFYFERRRVLAELAALEDPHGPEALRLRLRADELAAGIDAWTGGWFSRHAPRLSP